MSQRDAPDFGSHGPAMHSHFYGYLLLSFAGVHQQEQPRSRPEGYAQNGDIEKSRQLFQQMQKDGMKPNNVTWNAVIAGYAQHGRDQGALQLFKQMQLEGRKADYVTFASVLKACSTIEAQGQGKLIHAQLIEHGFELDVFVGNTLINLYATCGNLKDAHGVFERLPERNCVTWNTMIAGYALHGYGQEALQLFQQMRWEGQNPDNVTWNAMLTGYVQHGCAHEAISLFQQMIQEGRKPDNVTFVCILKACSNIAATDQGKLIHAHIIEKGFHLDVSVGNTLIDMYAKCGSLFDAGRVFDDLPKRDLVTWNSVIAGCTLNNNYKMVYEYFKNMQQSGFRPDKVTFLCLLSACSRGGFFERGHLHFMSMVEHHSIIPKLEHFNCMVDILGRKGCLEEAEILLRTMPLPPNIQGWTSLLCHCRTHRNVDIGKQCFDRMMSMDDRYASSYELMASMYVHSDMWDDGDSIQQLRRCVNAQKKPGEALIELHGKVHIFVVGDKSHMQSHDIYAKLKRLDTQIKHDGQVGFQLVV